MAEYEMKTKRGYDFFEVSSAFQKSVRRCLEEDALYWASELDQSGYGEYVWKRMKIMVSEDIGTAEPNLPANIHALYSIWADMKKKNDKHFPERFFLIHAVLLVVMAKKSRVVDNALIVSYNTTEAKIIPDWALDKHTRRGKAMGRGFKHFFDEGVKIANESGEDKYFKRARAILEGNASKPPDPFASGVLFEAKSEEDEEPKW
jgi:replication-associated recombination protein RarA